MHSFKQIYSFVLKESFAFSIKSGQSAWTAHKVGDEGDDWFWNKSGIFAQSWNKESSVKAEKKFHISTPLRNKQALGSRTKQKSPFPFQNVTSSYWSYKYENAGFIDIFHPSQTLLAEKMIYGQLIFMARLLEPNETGGGGPFHPTKQTTGSNWFVHNPS